MKEGKIQAHWFRTNVAIYSDEQRLSKQNQTKSNTICKITSTSPSSGQSKYQSVFRWLLTVFISLYITVINSSR